MRRLQQPTQVDLAPDGQPRVFRYRGAPHLVGQVLDRWRYGGRWWLQEPPRRCYTVQAGALIAELHAEDRPGGRWWLAAIQD